MVLEVPIVNVRPVKKSMSPSANNVESKRKSTPRKRKVKPRNMRPVPILVLSETIVRYISCCIVDICRVVDVVGCICMT